MFALRAGLPAKVFLPNRRVDKEQNLEDLTKKGYLILSSDRQGSINRSDDSYYLCS